MPVALTRRRLAAWLASVIAAGAACVEVRSTGFPCSASGTCPADLVCVADRCQRDRTPAQQPSDAAADDDASSLHAPAVDDAAPDDAAIPDALATDAASPPIACHDADDECAAGICAIDRCVTDVFVIPYASELPVIDGVTDAAWGNGSSVQAITHRLLGPPDPDVPDANAGEFQVMWNEEALFFRAQVRDTHLVHDDPGPSPSFRDDGVELFIDADGSRKSSVGAVDNPAYDQVMFGYGASLPANFTVHRIAGIEFRLAPTRVGDGYVVEAVMPWKALGAVPVPGGFIGLDVHVNDDDDGGERDRKWTWFGLQDVAPLDPRACARAVLQPPR